VKSVSEDKVAVLRRVAERLSHSQIDGGRHEEKEWLQEEYLFLKETAEGCRLPTQPVLLPLLRIWQPLCTGEDPAKP